MNYDQAKAIIAERAPDLHVDKDTGQRHIVVRKSEHEHPFCIMLPNLRLPPPIEARAAVPEQPATEDRPAIPAQPEVLAQSSESQHSEMEVKMLTDALDEALRHL